MIRLKFSRLDRQAYKDCMRLNRNLNRIKGFTTARSTGIVAKLFIIYFTLEYNWEHLKGVFSIGSTGAFDLQR